jgi:sortase A
VTRSKALLIAERTAWTIAVGCLGVWVALSISASEGRRAALARFAASEATVLAASDAPDHSLWSPQRVLAWREAMGQPGPEPLAVLRIPRIKLEVPVLEGTDDWTLNRAVGHIADTPAPGDAGNVGIAGHRDGFFRGLKDVRTGDELLLQTHSGTERFLIDHISVVDPDDVSVLDATSEPSITLVTCYPFYFIGSAPKRYIVKATRVASGVQKAS